MNETPPDIGLSVGTPVLTPTGHVPVEQLAPGTQVLAMSGSSAPFQTVVAVRRSPYAGPMIRIRADALGDGSPQADLLLPPGHGFGIVEEASGGLVELVQITLAGHDAVLAAGAAVETVRPHPDAPDCAPRRAPDAPLRAMLSWHAEQMGWATRQVIEDEPVLGTLRERLEAFPLSAALPPLPPFRDPD